MKKHRKGNASVFLQALAAAGARAVDQRPAEEREKNPAPYGIPEHGDPSSSDVAE